LALGITTLWRDGFVEQVAPQINRPIYTLSR
jgi:hypothetical protein